MKFKLPIILLIILSSFAYAEPVVLEKERIYANDFFQVKVEPIKNEISTQDYLSIIFSEVYEWKWVRSEPLLYTASETALYPAKETKFIIKLDPLENLASGTHILKAVFKVRNSNSALDIPLDTYIKSNSISKYSPDLQGTIDFPNEVDPREDNKIRLKLENFNPREYSEEEIKVTLESPLLGVMEASTGIAGRVDDQIATAFLEWPVSLAENQKPTKDTVVGQLEIDGQVQHIGAFVYNIVDYTERFKEEKKTESGFLKNKETIKYTNKGNNDKKQLIQHETGFFSRFFTSTNPKARLTKDIDGNRYFEWEIDLKSDENYTLEILVNYRWLFYAIILILLFLFYNYMDQSPLRITKEAHNIETAEGGISQIKININIKNEGVKPIENIDIIDKVPNIVDVLKDFDVGTLSPSRFTKKNGATLIKWEIPEIDPQEERILTYRIKSKLSILGDFSLPVANLKYSKGKRRKTLYSNSVKVEG